MARDIYAHVPPFGEAKVWSDEDIKKEKASELAKLEKMAGVGTSPQFEERIIYVKQVRLNGWYTREELIKILAMKEMQ